MPPFCCCWAMTNFFPRTAWLLAVLLASAWLVPNHYAPWTAFHAEFWCALTLVGVGAVVNFKNRHQLAWTPWQWVALVLIGQVVLDWILGTIPLAGVAWLCGLYLVGFVFCLRLGSVWQANADGEAVDFVFTAIVLAAVASAVLQLLQLSGFQTNSPWFNTAPASARLDANLAQPNHLATLELLALVGCSWLALRNKMSGKLSLAIATILVVGVMLTGSRTAVLNSVALLAAYPLCLPSQKSRSTYILAAAALGLWYAALLAVMPAVLVFMDAANFSAPAHARTVSGDLRLPMWILAADAIQNRPWWGYGWGQIPAAQMAVAAQHGEVSAFNSAHNLILDFALWGGAPIALLVFGYGCWWVRNQLRSPNGTRQSHTLLFLGVLSIHALLELPLHYAYFLLPFGVMLGTLESARISGAVTVWRKLVSQVGLAFCVAALVLTGVDYLKIEQAEKLLRMEAVRANYFAPDSTRLPKLWVLKHYEDFFLLSRLPPAKGLSEQQLGSMEDVVRTVPSEKLMYNMAVNYALNGYADRAHHWMLVACKTKGATVCSRAATNWRVEELERETGVPWNMP